MWTPHRLMIRRLTGLPADLTVSFAIGRPRRARMARRLLAASLLIGACDKSSTSAPQKAPAIEGPPSPQQTAAPDGSKVANKPQALSRYVNADKGFAIDFPASWKRETDPDGIFAIQASSPPEHPRDAFSENVYVMVKDTPEVTVNGEPRRLSLNDYFDLSRVNFRRISNDAVEREIGQIEINQQICPWVIFTHTFNKVNLKTIRYYLQSDQQIFIIACTATPDSFENYRETFRQIANSITFK